MNEDTAARAVEDFPCQPGAVHTWRFGEGPLAGQPVGCSLVQQSQFTRRTYPMQEVTSGLVSKRRYPDYAAAPPQPSLRSSLVISGLAIGR